MDDLFSDATAQAIETGAPLAARMRPRTLDEFVGQEAAVGPGTVLRAAIEKDTLTSLVLYGPAGCGKTSLARIIAGVTSSHFAEISAVSAGVGEVRAAIEAAKDRLAFSGRRTILFIDEIHRFSKSQQDALLHAVEDRVITLIGATTENPYFEVNAPLLSRSRVVVLQPLTDDDVAAIVEHALADPERGYGGGVTLAPEATERIVRYAGGDARAALTTLELAVSVAKPDAEGHTHVGAADVSRATQSRQLTYDKAGDAHYDIISAFIKSMRGSDPDAAVYWLARMIHGGEDPRFIARRMLIFASEDVGMADSQALLVAHAAVKAAEFIGWPECRINLSHAAVYLTLAPKSNSAYLAIDRALREVESGPTRAVPDHLRDRRRPGAEGYPAYRYPHDFPGGVVEQQYLPDGLGRGSFWRPNERDVTRREAPSPSGPEGEPGGA